MPLWVAKQTLNIAEMRCKHGETGKCVENENTFGTIGHKIDLLEPPNKWPTNTDIWPEFR